MDSIDGPISSAETAGIKINIKGHDLQLIYGNSQAEDMATTLTDKNFIGGRRSTDRTDPDRKGQIRLLLFKCSAKSRLIG